LVIVSATAGCIPVRPEVSKGERASFVLRYLSTNEYSPAETMIKALSENAPRTSFPRRRESRDEHTPWIPVSALRAWVSTPPSQRRAQGDLPTTQRTHTKTHRHSRMLLAGIQTRATTGFPCGWIPTNRLDPTGQKGRMKTQLEAKRCLKIKEKQPLACASRSIRSPSFRQSFSRNPDQRSLRVIVWLDSG
jgi:hypothetical protein